MNCILCGHIKSKECGYASYNDGYLCHPDSESHQDCYVLYTVYGQRPIANNI